MGSREFVEYARRSSTSSRVVVAVEEVTYALDRCWIIDAERYLARSSMGSYCSYHSSGIESRP